MKHDNAVVLGASGFIGSRLVKNLVAGDVNGLYALDVVPPRERLAGVKYGTVDVRSPIDPSWGQGASVIYNFAAIHRTPGHPEHEYFETNVAGALNAVALARACFIKTIVFTSSISVYGPCEDAVSEESPLLAVSSYGRSKRLAEQIHRQWLEEDADRRLLIVRPGVVFGPGERGNYTALARSLRGGYFVYPGRRDTVKSGGYVDELLRTMEFALERESRYALFNFAYPDASSIEEIVGAFGRVTGRRHNPLTLPWPLVKAAAKAFEAASTVGFKTVIHPDRVMKLVQSTRITPAWLLARGYCFSTNVESALANWRDETDGRFD